MPGTQPDTTYNIHLASHEEYQQSIALRLYVFCDIQGFPRGDEPDKYDAQALQVVITHTGKVVGSLRIIKSPDATKLGRIVIHPEHQGKGLGRKLIEYAEIVIRNSEDYDVKSVKLGSQWDKKLFYEKCGYEPKGDIYDDGGSPHIWMHKDL
ncbi:putative acetyl transferase [Kickxella alabastrina]|uniref:putative acetyl transferase n=1 Tax=Kickxella alabastrina TaxID=61397 RepID=UPI00222104D1|nr:putative acetyl transferase [Kickxella alabastrina]KAI7822266.1 putative acetyl transferase [Kickxella alabastrina]